MTDNNQIYDTNHEIMYESNRQLLNMRVLTTVTLAIAVILAGCTGVGSLGGDGDSNEDLSSNGVETDTSNDAEAGSGAEDGASSTVDEGSPTEDNWFNLSDPGYYEFDLAGIDRKTGEQVTGRLVYDAEAAGDGELTVSVDYKFGSEQFQSTTTGPADEFSAQLFLNEAYTPIATLQGVSLQYLFEMGFTDPAIGNYKQTTTDDGTQITEVTEKRSYAGVECFFVETTLDGTLSQEGCIRDAESGIAPYAATYTDEGDLELKVELVEFESR